jgi:hypothetical protein
MCLGFLPKDPLAILSTISKVMIKKMVSHGPYQPHKRIHDQACDVLQKIKKKIQAARHD